jgi:hypothetical protein
MVSSNTLVHLQATPQPGWLFAGWTGDVQSADPNLVFRATRSMTIQANFIQSQVALTARQIQEDWVLVEFAANYSFTYSVQASTDLRGWAEIKAYANTKTGGLDLRARAFRSNNVLPDSYESKRKQP